MRKHFWQYFFLGLMVLVCAFPFYCMVIMSTQTTEQIFRGVSLVPSTHFLENVRTVVSDSFWLSYQNSLFVSVLSTIFSVLISSMAGYALAAYRFRLRNLLYNFILITMMVPVSISMIGYMNEMRMLGLSKTLYPLMFVWLANGFGAFWMTQYTRGALPQEIVESARIDGSDEMRTFFQIVLPLLRPALGTLSLMIFLWSWNNYMLPLVIVGKASNYTIPLYIQTLGNQFRSDYAARIAGLLLSIFPLVLAFALGAKNFIRGLAAGAVKG